ncbi:MAG: hypothetical protein IPN10_14920 [Saprospiraceae bacterium]|nr:hypothetical protein [Saprospiraceae bacterium]
MPVSEESALSTGVFHIPVKNCTETGPLGQIAIDYTCAMPGIRMINDPSHILWQPFLAEARVAQKAMNSWATDGSMIEKPYYPRHGLE